MPSLRSHLCQILCASSMVLITGPLWAAEPITQPATRPATLPAVQQPMTDGTLAGWQKAYSLSPELIAELKPKVAECFRLHDEFLAQNEAELARLEQGIAAARAKRMVNFTGPATTQAMADLDVFWDLVRQQQAIEAKDPIRRLGGIVAATGEPVLARWRQAYFLTPEQVIELRPKVIECFRRHDEFLAANKAELDRLDQGLAEARSKRSRDAAEIKAMQKLDAQRQAIVAKDPLLGLEGIVKAAVPATQVEEGRQRAMRDRWATQLRLLGDGLDHPQADGLEELMAGFTSHYNLTAAQQQELRPKVEAAVAADKEAAAARKEEIAKFRAAIQAAVKAHDAGTTIVDQKVASEFIQQYSKLSMAGYRERGKLQHEVFRLYGKQPLPRPDPTKEPDPL